MNAKLKIYLLTVALIVVSILCGYLVVFKTHGNYGSFLVALYLFIIFLCIQVLQFLWIDMPENSFWTYNKRTIAAAVLTIPIAYGLIKGENNFENKTLSGDGKVITIPITYTYKHSGKGGISYFGVYQYVVNGQTYTQTLRNNNPVFKIGDTVEIVYSSGSPDIAKVIRYKSGL